MTGITEKKSGMLYPAMGDLKAHIPNRYMLVNVVARRARQIARSAEETGTKLDEKPVTLAIEEVAEGKLDTSGMDLTIEEEPEQEPEQKGESD